MSNFTTTKLKLSLQERFTDRQEKALELNLAVKSIAMVNQKPFSLEYERKSIPSSLKRMILQSAK